MLLGDVTMDAPHRPEFLHLFITVNFYYGYPQTQTLFGYLIFNILWPFSSSVERNVSPATSVGHLTPLTFQHLVRSAGD